METIPIAQFYVKLKLTVIIQIYTILLLEWKQIQELKILVKRHPDKEHSLLMVRLSLQRLSQMETPQKQEVVSVVLIVHFQFVTYVEKNLTISSGHLYSEVNCCLRRTR